MLASQSVTIDKYSHFHTIKPINHKLLSMPWETKFDIDNAIGQATNVFWAKGYKSTSLNDLLSSMKINKGSFYNTFGSKKELFTKSLDLYTQEFKSGTLDYLATFKDPVFAIESFFDILIERSCNDPEKKGCFIFNVATDLPNYDSDTVKSIKACFDDITNFIKEQLEKGVSMNLIDKKIDTTSTAKTLLAFSVSIRVLSRGIMEGSELISIKTEALKLIKSEL